MLSLIHAMEKIQSLWPSWKIKGLLLRHAKNKPSKLSSVGMGLTKNLSTHYKSATYVSDTDWVQSGQLVDGQAVRVVSSGGQQRLWWVQFDGVDPATLLVDPRARRGEVVSPRGHGAYHPGARLLTLPVLQHGNARDLSRQNVSHKEL